MTKHAWMSRRAFVRMIGLASTGAQARWLRAAPTPGGTRLAFLGAMGETHGIHVFAIEDDRWTLRQVIASEAPVSLALHPTGRTLYVLHGVSEHEGLPTGSVEAYRVHTRDGSLASLGRRGLSLSATMPRHIAVAPDGSSLAVAIHGGGAYNLLPIDGTGRVGRVCGIVKETGCGPIAEHQETAHPQMVLFDTSGQRLIGTDSGSDQLNVLTLGSELSVHGRHAMPPGSGPQHLVLHPNGHLLYVGHALDGSISGFRYDVHCGEISGPVFRGDGVYQDSLVIHPSGDFLYASLGREVIVWRIETATGALQELQRRRIETDNVFAINAPSWSCVVALTTEGVVQLRVEEASGLLSRAVLVSRVPGACSIALQ